MCSVSFNCFVFCFVFYCDKSLGYKAIIATGQWSSFCELYNGRVTQSSVSTIVTFVLKLIQSLLCIALLQLEFAEERYAMLKTNSEAFKKEASAASEKSRSLQVAYSKTQATLDSTTQVIVHQILLTQCHIFLYILFQRIWFCNKTPLFDLKRRGLVGRLLDLNSSSCVPNCHLLDLFFADPEFSSSTPFCVNSQLFV